MYLDMVKRMKAEKVKNPIVSIGSTKGGPFLKKKQGEKSDPSSCVTFSLYGVEMPFDDFSIRLWEHFVKGGPIPFPMDFEQFKRYRRVSAAEREVQVED